MTFTLGDARKYPELRPYLGKNGELPDLPTELAYESPGPAPDQGHSFHDNVQLNLRRDFARVRQFYSGDWKSEEREDSSAGWKMFDPAHWTPAMHRFQEAERENVLKWMKRKRLGTLIEVGAGSGTYMAEAIGEKLGYIGYEIVPWLAGLGQSRIQAFKNRMPGWEKPLEMKNESAFGRGVANLKSSDESRDSLLLLPFNLFGNFHDPVQAAEDFTRRGVGVALSTYGTDHASTAARLEYYRRCGYKGLQPFWTPFGVLITSQDGLHSYAYHGEVLRSFFGDPKNVEVRRNGDIGLTYFFRPDAHLSDVFAPSSQAKQASLNSRKKYLDRLASIEPGKVHVSLLEIESPEISPDDATLRHPVFRELGEARLVSLARRQAVLTTARAPALGGRLRVELATAEAGEPVQVAGVVTAVDPEPDAQGKYQVTVGVELPSRPKKKVLSRQPFAPGESHDWAVRSGPGFKVGPFSPAFQRGITAYRGYILRLKIFEDHTAELVAYGVDFQGSKHRFAWFSGQIKSPGLSEGSLEIAVESASGNITDRTDRWGVERVLSDSSVDRIRVEGNRIIVGDQVVTGIPVDRSFQELAGR
jgi:hypothetical protein